MLVNLVITLFYTALSVYVSLNPRNLIDCTAF